MQRGLMSQEIYVYGKEASKLLAICKVKFDTEENWILGAT
jgi:hypothetical protein